MIHSHHKLSTIRRNKMHFANLFFMVALFFAVIPTAKANTIDVGVGAGKLLTLNTAAKTVFLAAPDIATVKVPSPKQIFITGLKAGSTTLFILDANSQVIAKRELRISPNVDSLSSMLKSHFPHLDLTLTSGPGSVLIRGQVANPGEHSLVIRTAANYLGNPDLIIDQLSVQTSQQVNLRVHIAEISRTVQKEFGISWQNLFNADDLAVTLLTNRDFLSNNGDITSSGFGSAHFRYNGGNGDTNINGIIDALESESLINILAEPNLTTMSGQSASFLVGGEFPYSNTGDNGTSSISFKQYGVGLNFTPQVISRDRINIKLQPEISQLSFTDSVLNNGARVPNLLVRRLDTTVELSHGQSFAIGGLLQNNITDAVDALPGLGTIPILGKLFSSTSYINQETELVIIVTPEIVDHGTNTAKKAAISASLKPLTGLEYIFARKIQGKENSVQQDEGSYMPNKYRLDSQAGFLF